MADGIPSGSVTFTSDSESDTGAINSLGYAQISATSLTPGTYTYQASYRGDASFQASTSSTQTLTITKGLTSIALSSGGGAATAVTVISLSANLQTDSLAP